MAERMMGGPCPGELICGHPKYGQPLRYPPQGDKADTFDPTNIDGGGALRDGKEALVFAADVVREKKANDEVPTEIRSRAPSPERPSGVKRLRPDDDPRGCLPESGAVPSTVPSKLVVLVVDKHTPKVKCVMLSKKPKTLFSDHPHSFRKSGIEPGF